MRIFHVREVAVESVPRSMFKVNWLSPGVMSTYTIYNRNQEGLEILSPKLSYCVG